MLEIYRTNVREEAEAKEITSLISMHFPDCRVVFDLDDCDRILKVADGFFSPGKVTMLVEASGFKCEPLE